MAPAAAAAGKRRAQVPADTAPAAAEDDKKSGKAEDTAVLQSPSESAEQPLTHEALAVLDSEKFVGQGLVYEESAGSSDEAAAHGERPVEVQCPTRRARWSPIKYKRPKPVLPGSDTGRVTALEPEVVVPQVNKERSLAQSLGVELDGLTVVDVRKDDCADKHGVRKGMTLKGIHGMHVTDDASADAAFLEAPSTFRATFQVPGRWCPPAMTSATLVAFPAEQKLVLFGGVVDAVPTNNTWVYSHANARWQCLEEGRQQDARQQPQQLNRRRRRQADTSSRGGGWPAPRCAHQAAAVSDTEMVVFGGADISVAMYYNDLWLFDLEKYTWSRIDAGGVPPCPRWQFSMVAVERRLFVYGGESKQYEILDDLHVYDHDPLANFECTLLCGAAEGNPPADQYAAHLRHRVYEDRDLGPGGELSQRGFRVVSVETSARYAPPAVLLTVTVSQPRSQVNHKHLAAALAAALELPPDQLASHKEGQRRWLKLNTVWPTPPPRMLHAAATVGDKMIVIGGVSPQPGQASSVWLLECQGLVWREVKAHSVPVYRPPSTASVPVGHAGLLAHGGRDQLPSADLQTTPFHTPTTWNDGKLGVLVGHVCMAYDNLCLVHGGKLDGRLQGDWVWCLDLLTEVWSKLEIGTGLKKGDKSACPSARWKHCVSVHTEVSHTVKMDKARGLPPIADSTIPSYEQERKDARRKSKGDGQKPPQIDWRNSSTYPLAVDDEAQKVLKRMMAGQRKDLAAQRQAHAEGLLLTQGSTPVVVRTACCIIWGGGGQVKKSADLWRLCLSRDETGEAMATLE